MRIITTRWGTKYSAFDVERLYSQCRAWCDFDQFVCITDQPEQLHPGIERIEFPSVPKYTTWWSKIIQFSLFTQGQSVSMDIDIHIRDRAEFQFSTNRLLMQLDPLAQYHPHKNIKYVNSSVITYEGDWSWITEKYNASWQDIQARYRGDQEWLWGDHQDRIAYHTPIFESYKWSAKQRGYSNMPIVNYHGEDAKAKA